MHSGLSTGNSHDTVNQLYLSKNTTLFSRAHERMIQPWGLGVVLFSIRKIIFNPGAPDMRLLSSFFALS